MGKYFKAVTKSSTDEEVERRVLFCWGDAVSMVPPLPESTKNANAHIPQFRDSTHWYTPEKCPPVCNRRCGTVQRLEKNLAIFSHAQGCIWQHCW